ncbi:MAG: hypothetical protein ACR2ME_09225 [Acidimicrobiia bacterium]
MIVAVLSIACASGSADTTASTTSVVVDTQDTTGSGSVGSLSDMPQECLDAFDAFLREIEPMVADFDFVNSTQADFEVLGAELDASSGSFDEETASCPELDMATEESFAAMVDYARDVAPGTVPYLEYVASFLSETPTAGTGDCETDIDSFMEIVNSGTPMRQLTLGEGQTATGLLASISASCSTERYTEVFADPAVSEFLGS